METKKESKFKKYELHWDYIKSPNFVKFTTVEAVSEEAARSEFKKLYARLGTPVEVYKIYNADDYQDV